MPDLRLQREIVCKKVKSINIQISRRKKISACHRKQGEFSISESKGKCGYSFCEICDKITLWGKRIQREEADLG